MDISLDAATPRPTFRVLVVEDDEDSLGLMAELLRAFGVYAVTTARTGEDGLRRCRGEAYDLLVADVGLPGISGLEMLDQLRLEGLLPKAALVVVCSAYDGQQEPAERRGARFFPKPIDIGKLCDLIERAVAPQGRLPRVKARVG